ncbi:MAG: hypothetical protein C0404_08210 [Verrucomicrobia bacterium]|nr:hypothetical protein [Verrucomicrobiota bacterium]
MPTTRIVPLSLIIPPFQHQCVTETAYWHNSFFLAFTGLLRSVVNMPQKQTSKTLFLFDLRQCALGGIMEVGSRRILRAHCYFGPHIHGPERLELAIVTDGHQTQVVNGRRYDIKANHCLLVRPGETHGDYNTTQAPSTVSFVVLGVTRGGTHLLNLRRDDARRLQDALTGISPRCFRLSDDARRLFDHIVVLLFRRRQAGSGDALQDMAIQSAMATFLAEIVSSAANAPRPRPAPWLTRVLRHIDANIADHFSVKDLAKVAGASPSYFMAKFKQETGLSPNDYIYEHRIMFARKLLRRPEARITSVAHELGFSSSQHFATAFKRFTGFSPAQYRRDPAWVYLGPDHILSHLRKKSTHA